MSADYSAQMATWEAKKAARSFAAKQLQAAHPHLIPNAGNSLIAAAKNIRIECARAFPGVAFSVRTKRFSGGNDIRVSWTDGPTTEQVKAISSRYESGSFDGMTDSYDYRKDHGWTDAFGESKYIFEERDYSDAAIAGAIRTVWARYEGNVREMAAPAVEDFRQGRLYNVPLPHLNESVQCFINRELSRRTWCIGHER